MPWNIVSLLLSGDLEERMSSIWSTHRYRRLYDTGSRAAETYPLHPEQRLQARNEHTLNGRWNGIQQWSQPCNMCHPPSQPKILRHSVKEWRIIVTQHEEACRLTKAISRNDIACCSLVGGTQWHYLSILRTGIQTMQ